MSLRLRLREDTRAAHDEVDANFNTFNAVLQEGYARFLLAHGSALKLISARTDIKQCRDVSRDITMMIEGIQRDLQEIGQPDEAVPSLMHEGKALHPDAVRYVIWGSQIGMTVLHRRWCEAGMVPVLATSQFLCAPFDKSLWKSLCRRLSETPALGETADRVVADAQAIFGIYAASTQLTQPDLHYA